MSGFDPSRNELPIVVSRAQPFATVLLSDFGGPRSRQRLVLRTEPLPAWLSAIVPYVPAGEMVVVAARGRAKKPATTRIRSIVVFSARRDMPEFAHVFIEEHDSGARLADETAPFHVVRCALLPERVRFVETATPAPSRLKAVRLV